MPLFSIIAAKKKALSNILTLRRQHVKQCPEWWWCPESRTNPLLSAGVVRALSEFSLDYELRKKQNICPYFPARVDEWNILSKVDPEPMCVPAGGKKSKVSVWSQCFYFCLLQPKLPMQTIRWTEFLQVPKRVDFVCLGTPPRGLKYTT